MENPTIKLIVDGVDSVDDVAVDYDYSREKYKTLLDHGEELLKPLVDLAKDSEHPRAFEVAFNAMRQLADINDKLLNMQRKKQVIDQSKPPSQKENTGAFGSEAVDGEIPFSGTTANLLEMLQKVKDDQAIDADYKEIEEKVAKKRKVDKSED